MPVSGTDCIICDVCELTFHKKCQGLSQEAHEAIKKYELVWLCTECKKEVTTVAGRKKKDYGIEEEIKTCIYEAETKIIRALNETKQKEDIAKQIQGRITEIERSFT